MDGNGYNFRGIKLSVRDDAAGERRAITGFMPIIPGQAVEDPNGVVVGIAAHSSHGHFADTLIVGVPVWQRGKVFVVAVEDVAKGQRAAALGDGAVGGIRDDMVGRAAMDAWWLHAVRRGEVGKLKLGELPTEAELAGEP
jgi:hypothetical protein